MPTSVTKEKTITIGDKEITMRPLKIKYLKKFMAVFDGLQKVKTSSASLDGLVECCVVAMEQYSPELADSEVLEEILDMDEIYEIIEAAAGIKMDQGNVQTVEDQAGTI